MSTTDKSAFKMFVSKYRQAKVTGNFLKKIDGPAIPLPEKLNTSGYKLIRRFREQLFEFEISDERLNRQSQISRHLHVQIALRKKLLACQAMTAQGNYLNVLQNLNRIYSLAVRHQLPQVQKESANQALQLYALLASETNVRQWEERLLKSTLQAFVLEKLSARFKSLVCTHPCCRESRPPVKEADLFIFRCLHQSTSLIVLGWMHGMLKSKMLFEQGDFKQALRELNILESQSQQHTEVLPCYLIAQFDILKLENCWHLKAHPEIKRSYQQFHIRMNCLSPEQLPHIKFYLCYQLHTANFRELEKLLINLKRQASFTQIHGFTSFLYHIEAHACFQQGKIRDCLKIINRQGSWQNQLCTHQLVELKIIEILSLNNLRRYSKAYDKTVLLRKFIRSSEHLRFYTLYSSLACALIENTNCGIKKKMADTTSPQPAVPIDHFFPLVIHRFLKLQV